MQKIMYKPGEVADLIKLNKCLLLAGEESLLKQLPEGKWIGGTIPYFMAENGGLSSRELILVNEIPNFASNINIKSYNIDSIKDIYTDGFENGFTILIIPCASELHLSFAVNAPEYAQFATKPLIGWVSGVNLNELSFKTAKSFACTSGSMSDKQAVAMHIELPSGKYAEINILNIFKQGNGDTIEFPESGFHATDVFINGIKQNFADYLILNHIDLRLPLVADYSGCMINISFQGIEQEERRVNFYAPVFAGIKYKQAAHVSDYIQQFMTMLPEKETPKMAFSCNCILNYLYSELEGKKTGTITGPITFGEIAYQLLNQTMAYIEVKDL